MDNATESLNETANTTINSTGYWKPLGDNGLPDIQGYLTDAETYFVNMLLTWGLEPMHVMFQLVLGCAILIIVYYIFVKITSGSSKMFVPIFYIAAIIILLLVLEVI